MSDEVIKQLEEEATEMRRRALTREEKAAIGEEMLKGKIHPDTDPRKRKNAVRSAIDSVRPGKKQRAG